jgi:hypothetical protein
MQLSKTWGAANGKVEIRAAGARNLAQELQELLLKFRRKRHIQVKQEPPKFIIHGVKKGIWSLMIVFIKIQAVTRFPER